MVIKDIAPELLEKIREDFKGRLLADKTLQALMERVESGKADYNTAYEIAIIISKHLSKAYKGNITADILPESKMYYNIADRTIRPTLIELHEKVSEASAQIQTSLNQAANIGIKGLKADLSTDRIDGIINKLTSYESYNKGEWILGETIITYGQAIVDDTIRANAGFHFKLGMSAKIERTSMGKCCSWCDKLVGTYEYPNVPKDVYRRHKHCRCRVLFNSGGKKRQDVWTKKWVDTENKFDKAIVKFKRGAITAHEVAKVMGYNPLPQDEVVNILRKTTAKWLEKLTKEEQHSISKYTFNGIDSDGLKLYEKINKMGLGSYRPRSIEEELIITKHTMNIETGLLKNKLDHDIMVYRNEWDRENITKNNKKFLSTAVTFEGVVGERHNVAIIVPKGTNGAYVETISKFSEQREFLLNRMFRLIEISGDGQVKLFKVVNEDE